MTSYNISESYHQVITVHSQNDSTFGAQERPNENYTDFQTDGSGENQYRLNPQGFRSDNDYHEILKNQEDYIVVYGCSHTEGIGVPLKNTWGEVLGRKLGLKVINYGLTSAAPEWGTYMYYYHNYLLSDYGNNPKHNFFLKPPDRRLMITNGRIVSFFQDFNWSTTANDGSLIYNSLADNISHEVVKTVDTEKDFKENGNFPFDSYYEIGNRVVDAVCEKENLHMVDWKVLGEEYPKASDNMHFGKEWHADISDIFYKKIKSQLI